MFGYHGSEDAHGVLGGVGESLYPIELELQMTVSHPIWVLKTQFLLEEEYTFLTTKPTF